MKQNLPFEISIFVKVKKKNKKTQNKIWIFTLHSLYINTGTTITVRNISKLQHRHWLHYFKIVRKPEKKIKVWVKEIIDRVHNIQEFNRNLRWSKSRITVCELCCINLVSTYQHQKYYKKSSSFLYFVRKKMFRLLKRHWTLCHLQVDRASTNIYCIKI